MTSSTQDHHDQRRVIVVGWDGSERSRDALALASDLALELSMRVRIARVYPDVTGFEGRRRHMREETEGLMRSVPKACLAGVDFDEELLMAPSPAEGLYHLVAEPDVEYIVLGSTHRGGLGRVLPGSVASHLLHGSPRPVVIAPAGYADTRRPGIRSIAVAFDGTPEARVALDAAVALARSAEATIRVVSVVAPFSSMPWTGIGAYTAFIKEDVEREVRQEDLDNVLPTLPPEVRADGRLREGDPAEEIVDECEKGVDLLVMGSRGYGTVGRVLLGSVSDAVLRSAPCPVLVVPQGAPREEERTPVQPVAATA